MEFFDLTAFAGVCLLISSFFGMLIFRAVFETVNVVLFVVGLIFYCISIYRFHGNPNEYMFWFSWACGIGGGLVLSGIEWLLERKFFWGTIPRVTHKSLFFAFLYAQIFVLLYGLILFSTYGNLFYKASVIRFTVNEKTHTSWCFSCEKSYAGYCLRVVDTDGKSLIKKLSAQEEKMIDFQLANYVGLDFDTHKDFVIYFEYGQAAVATKERKIPLERSLGRNVLKSYLESLIR